MYYAGGIVVHNCRCWARYILRKADGTDVDVYDAPAAPAGRIPRSTDRPGVGTRQYNPTTVVTLNGRTRAQVILGNGEAALMRQERPDLIVIRYRGDTIARAVIRNGEVAEISISPAHRDKDIEGLIRRSVEHSAQRRP